MTHDEPSDYELVCRAAAAWARAAARTGGGIPMVPDLAVEELDGLRYVTWRESGALVACFRVRNDGKLKALRRIPAELRDR
jgi:hypothetical protein